MTGKIGVEKGAFLQWGIFENFPYIYIYIPVIVVFLNVIKIVLRFCVIKIVLRGPFVVVIKSSDFNKEEK